jgi:hypothetical protein
MRRSLIPLAVLVVLSAARPAGAQPCDPAEAGARTARIQAHLDREKRRGKKWDNIWLVTFATLAAVQGTAIATETTIGEYDEAAEAGLIAGTVKASVGALAHVILRLKVVRPKRTGDPCTDLAEAERALRKTAKNEKRSFYLNHLGSFALNVGALLWLGLQKDEWGEGAQSIALGYPVGLLAVYTQPRGALKAHRRGTFDEVSATVGVARRPDFTGLVLAGTF